MSRSPQRNPTALKKALSFLQAGIESGTWHAHGSLPPVRKLAAQAGVSPTTMSRAVKDLKNRGILRTVWGGSIRIAGQEDSIGPFVEPAESRGSRLKVRDMLHRDIIEGVFSPGDILPSLKELQMRYGTSFRTMKKALADLCSSGIVEPWKKTFRIALPAFRSFMHAIDLFGFSKSGFSISAPDHRSRELVRSLERLCARTTILLRQHAIGLDGAWREESHSLTSEEPFGYIYYLGTWFSSYGTPRDETLAHIRRACRTQKPIAIFDESSDTPLPRDILDSPNVKAFSPAAFGAGMEVGNLLLRLGHRSIIFLASNFQHTWARRRFEGLRNACSRSGLDVRVEKTVHDMPRTQHSDIALALADLPQEQYRLIYSLELPPPEDSGALAEQLKRIREKVPARILTPQRKQVLRRRLEVLIRLIESREHRDLLRGTNVINGIYYFVEDYAMNIWHEPLFSQALKNHEASAWVCDTDYLAIAARTFLRQRHIPVPQRISVVGFDNIQRSVSRGIATYDFNFSHIAGRLFNYVIHPRAELSTGRRRGIEEVRGTIVRRSSLGKAPEKS